jgi:hypothetical protein
MACHGSFLGVVLFDEYSDLVTAAEAIIPPPRLKRKRASAAWLSPDGRLRRATRQEDGEPGWRFKIRKRLPPQAPAHGYWPDLARPRKVLSAGT